jgi:hypothetical protein
MWAAKEGMEAGTINAILDVESRTEIFRRISGFQCMVQGILRPMLEPLENEKTRWEAAKRAEVMLDRVEAHLRAHAGYYTIKYLEYLARRDTSELARGFAERVLYRSWTDNNSQKRAPWLDETEYQEFARNMFDLSRSFVDRNIIVVPVRAEAEPNAVDIFLEKYLGEKDLKPEKLGVGRKRTEHDVEVPFDGFHIEAVAGECILPDVPSLPAEAWEVSVKGRPL